MLFAVVFFFWPFPPAASSCNPAVSTHAAKLPIKGVIVMLKGCLGAGWGQAKRGDARDEKTSGAMWVLWANVGESLTRRERSSKKGRILGIDAALRHDPKKEGTAET